MKKRGLFIVGIFTIIFIIVIISSPQVEIKLSETKLDKEYLEKASFVEIVNECNSELFATSECFIGNIKTFFDYTKNDDFLYEDNQGIWLYDGEYTSRQVSNEEIFIQLKERGGVCYDWSILYLKLCEETDFKCELIIEDRILPIKHSYIIMSNSTHFCKLDQKSLECGINE